MEEKEIKKVLKVKKSPLIWTIILILISIILISTAVYIDGPMGKEAKSLHELIYNYEEDEGEYVKIDIAYIPYPFAVEEIDNEELIYYFVLDNEGYIYIARITDETYEEIEELKEEQGDDFSYELKGFTYDLPSDLKEIAITAYNEVYGEEVFTIDNIEEYVGSVYLDETITPQSENAATLIFIAFILVIAAIISLILFIIYKVSSMKIDKERLKLAKEELERNDIKIYNKQKTYLTNSYLISNYRYTYILEYREILWAYPLINYHNGVAIGKHLIIYTSSNKKISIGYSNNVNNQTIEEIMNKIREKNPSIRLGLTDENQEYFKQYKKENK